VNNKYGIPIGDLPSHCLDAVDAAERSLARTLIIREGHAVAAIVPMSDLDRIDPPDPSVGGTDPLLSICGTCKHDEFVDALDEELESTASWLRSSASSPREER